MNYKTVKKAGIAALVSVLAEDLLPVEMKLKL